jgi:polyvinyl alcohol dehydrogenase (cytochrome)
MKRPIPAGGIRIRRWLFAAVLGMAVTCVLPAQSLSDWPNFGQNPANSSKTLFGPLASEAKTLKLKWTFTAGGEISARAAVVNGVAYFPDWGGNLWAVDATTGTKIWGHQLSDYGLPSGTVSRTTPAFENGELYVATQAGAYLLAINAASGNLTWKTQLEQVDTHALISASPVVVLGIVYTGVASLAEGGTLYGVPDIATSNARGSVVAINASSGKIIWKTYTVPSGYTGAGVWGSNLVVDLLRGTVFAGTGDNYSVPTDPAYLSCVGSGGAPASCISSSDYSDSIVAFDMYTGTVRWATRLMNWNQSGIANGTDFWNVDCDYQSFGFPNNGPQCPPNHGPDYDFGSAPNEVTYASGSGLKTIIGAGQKSGLYYALDPDTGAVLWQNLVGPGSSLGGMEWGSATDGQRIYVALSDFYGIPYNNGTIHAGSWSALDPATGTTLWQVADPNGAVDLAPVAVSNGVVYAASMAGSGTAPNMFALDAATGKTIWSFAAQGSVIAGATVMPGMIYWGSGYTHLPLPGFITGNTFYAFSVSGK